MLDFTFSVGVGNDHRKGGRFSVFQDMLMKYIAKLIRHIQLQEIHLQIGEKSLLFIKKKTCQGNTVEV